MQLPFDPEDPPEEPPAGADRLVWRLAYLLDRAHQPTVHGWCIACRPSTLWPCPPARTAAAALLCAVGAAAALPALTRPAQGGYEEGRLIMGMEWERPKRCDNSGPNCLEVSLDEATGARFVRNSGDPTRIVRFTAEEWGAFVTSVRDGQYGPVVA
jgi:hypothetical protein